MTDRPELTKLPVFVQGLYEPTQDELTVEKLEVNGRDPARAQRPLPARPVSAS